MALVLSNAEVEGLLDLEQAMRLTESTLKEQAEGTAVTYPPLHMAVPGAGTLRVVSGAVAGTGRMGLRVSGLKSLAPIVPGRGAAMLLFDVDSGDLLCVTAFPFSLLRTAAVFGVATRSLAAPDARDLALIGTGYSAMSLLGAAIAVRPIERVRVYGRNADKRRQFVAEAREEMEAEVSECGSAAEAAAGAQVVYVSTSSPAPVLVGSDVPEGALVASMGSAAELDESVYLDADRVLVSARRHEEGHRLVLESVEEAQGAPVPHTLLDLDAAGKLGWGTVGELCDVVAGEAPPRREGETIVLRESQGGYGDVGLAAWVYAMARERGLGAEVEL